MLSRYTRYAAHARRSAVSPCICTAGACRSIVRWPVAPAVSPRSGARLFVAAASPASIESMYQRKTPVEHVLLRPGMYIGSSDPHEVHGVAWHAKKRSLQPASMEIVPGLLKLFDEILVNALDNKVRDASMSKLEVRLLPTPHGTAIEVMNDGRGIPVQMHAEEGMYVPELVLGHLLTGSNFNDDDASVTGGRYGYGAKLTNIFSKEFTVETLDSAAGLSFRKTWRNNMLESEAAQVAPAPGKAHADEFTRVRFLPDYHRFGMQDLPDGTRAAIELRALDAAAVLGDSVQVSLNGESLPCRSFADLVGMYEPANAKQPVFHFSTPAGWDIAIAAAPSTGHTHSLPLPIVNGGAHCLSYVNGMRTVRGGTHVAAVLSQVVPALADAAAKAVGPEGSHAITPAMVKQHVRVYINAAVPNATFDSQAKEQCVTPATELQRAAKLPAKFLKQLTQDSGIVQQLAEAASAKYSAASSRAVKRVLKENPLSGLAKLEDANWAGTRKGQQCTLILTEGDSAKALAVAGLAVVGRDQYGVFPLRGKVLNVRDLSPTAAVKNAEVAAIINILGLDFAKSYAGVAAAERGLRYGKVMIMTDQDHDGAHIKGLLINLFHTFWPELVEQGGFLEQFITPVIKARKGKQCHEFFSQRTFHEWCAQDSAWAGGKGWAVKYYKGLGTNTAAEGRAYFRDLLKHRVPFEAGDAAEDSDRIQLAFSKQLADRRKDWLSAMQQAREQVLGMPAAAGEVQAALAGAGMAPGNALLQPGLAAAGSSTYTQFIDEELIEFSRADLVRSIPSAIDGLKPSQRKVLHACFQRGASETKVAQLAGYVAERTAYHHGEASLIATIVGMAQDFVGSNNIPLLQAIGQFGTRLAGGKDAASARYIFTALSPMARLLFPAQDDGLLCHRVDDGQLVEPVAFVPIIPMALVNRSDGIGTGWSTSVPSHDPLWLVDDTLQWLQRGGQPLTRDQLPKQYDSQQPAAWPWVRGFRGRIELGVPGKSFITRGVADWVDEDVWWERAATRRSKRGEADVSVLHITELPVGRWTDDFKAHLAQLKERDQVLDFQDHHTDTAVDFLVKLSSHQADAIMTGKTTMDQLFKLATTLQVGNMHMFDAAGRIKRYRSPAEVQLEHRELRMRLYELRKARDELLAGAEAAKATSTAQFIDDVVHGRIQVMGRPYADVVATCAEKQYTNLQELAASARAQALEAGIPELALPAWIREGSASSAGAADGFGYLLQLPLSQLTHEARGSAHASASKHQAKLRELQGTSASDLWALELQALRVELSKQLQPGGPERS